MNLLVALGLEMAQYIPPNIINPFNGPTGPTTVHPMPIIDKRYSLKEGDLIRWALMPKDIYEIKNVKSSDCDIVRVVADRPERLNQIYSGNNLLDMQADFESSNAIIELVEFSICFDCDKKFEGLHFLCSTCRENQ